MVRATATAVMLLLATAMLGSGSALAAGEQPGQIDSCTVIDEAGTYELDAAFAANDTGAATDANATDGNETAPGNQTGEPGTDNGTDEASAANQTGEPTADNQTDERATLGNGSDACLLVTANDVVLEGNGAVVDGSTLTAANLTDGNVTNGTDANVTDANETDGDANVTEADANVTEDDANVTDGVVNETGATPEAGTNETAGNASELTGIAVRPAQGQDRVENVTIRNVTVRNWRLGVSLDRVSNATLDNVTLRNNTVSGVEFVDGGNGTNATMAAGQ